MRFEKYKCKQKKEFFPTTNKHIFNSYKYNLPSFAGKIKVNLIFLYKYYSPNESLRLSQNKGVNTRKSGFPCISTFVFEEKLTKNLKYCSQTMLEQSTIP